MSINVRKRTYDHAHSHNLSRIFTGRLFWIAKDAKFLHADIEDAD